MTTRSKARDLGALVRDIRLVVFDFDGVFTDNTVLVFDDGTEAVSCWRGDGLGLRELRRLGIETFVLSMETNAVVAQRCRKLSLPMIQGCEDKPTALAALAAERGLSLSQIAYVGNDINDLECLRMVALPIVVSDAHASVLRAAKWRTTLPGGRGAVREVCDMIGARRRAATRRIRAAARP